jgi:cell division protein FtsQ
MTTTAERRSGGSSPPYPEPALTGRPRWMRRLGMSAIVVLVLATMSWVIAISPVLGVHEVRVEGTSLLTPAQVRAAADLPSGLPLVRVDRGGVRAKVGALPEVRSVTVEVTYPTTVVIHVVERTAVAYSKSASGALSLLDASGVSFRAVAAAPPGLPEITAAEGPVRESACAVVALLPAAIRTQVRTVSATSPLAVVLNLGDGRTVVWGGVERSQEKARILPALLTQPGTRIDISTPGVVVVR